MIEIYNTLVDEIEVVGVGPLMTKRPADAVPERSGERQFYFEVYTRQSKFIVTTDWLSFRDPNLAEVSGQEETAIKEAHKALRRCLISGSFAELGIYK